MTVKNIFDVASSAMSAQMTRLNTIASNMANADAVSATRDGAFRPMRPVFETVYSDQLGRDGISTARVRDVVSLDREPTKSFRPDHPLADAEGYVYESTVNSDEEMVEMLEASRQYQNNVEVVSTLRSLMMRTISMGK